MSTLFGFGDITKGDLRPCYIICNDGKVKALFHCWCSLVDIRTIDIGAVVELEDGTVTLIHPQSIEFSDDAFSKYCWNERGTK